MSSLLLLKVFVFVLLHLTVNAFTPYASQFGYNYPQIPIPNYGQQIYPYPMDYQFYPNYQTPVYGRIPQTRYPQMIPVQGGVYPIPFPYMQQTYVQTPYGNIPVEVVDMDVIKNTETPIHNNGMKPESSSSTTSFIEEKKNVDFMKPVSTSSVIQSKPQSTTITRTLNPQDGKINVIVQPNESSMKRQDNMIGKDDENLEDNETTTTTKKYYSLFG